MYRSICVQIGIPKACMCLYAYSENTRLHYGVNRAFTLRESLQKLSFYFSVKKCVQT